MYYAFLFILSVLPAVFLLWFFEKQDKGEKEPRRLKNKVFLLGVLMVVIAAVIETGMDSFASSFQINHWVRIAITAFLIAALVEEGLKLYVVKKYAFNHEKYNEIMDGITYMVIASLGFAVFENILYVMPMGAGVGVMRAVLAVPAHAMFSGVMGYYIGKAKFENNKVKSRKLMLIGFLFALLYHGLYDFFLMSETGLVLAVVPLMVLMAAHLKHLINKARFEDKSQKHKPLKFGIKRVLRIIFGSSFILFAVVALTGTIMAAVDKQLPTEELFFVGPTVLISFTIGYFLLRTKKRK